MFSLCRWRSPIGPIAGDIDECFLHERPRLHNLHQMREEALAWCTLVVRETFTHTCARATPRLLLHRCTPKQLHTRGQQRLVLQALLQTCAQVQLPTYSPQPTLEDAVHTLQLEHTAHIQRLRLSDLHTGGLQLAHKPQLLHAQSPPTPSIKHTKDTLYSAAVMLREAP